MRWAEVGADLCDDALCLLPIQHYLYKVGGIRQSIDIRCNVICVKPGGGGSDGTKPSGNDCNPAQRAVEKPASNDGLILGGILV